MANDPTTEFADESERSGVSMDPVAMQPELAVSAGWFKSQLGRLEINRAVVYVLIARGWQLVAGPVTALLIATYFSGDMQGYFYTFGSLLALQLFVELGLHGLLINFASHEWTKLSIDTQGGPVGDPIAMSRLASLVRQAMYWYGLVSLLFVSAAGGFGLWFFSQSSNPEVQWRAAWMVSVLLSGLSLLLLPLVAILEGCNQVVAVNRVRTLQAITGNLAVWAAIAVGAGLWTVPVIAAVKLLWDGYLSVGAYGRFFHVLRSATIQSPVHWLQEVWPLQWRTSAQSVFSYFSYALFTPLMFYYHDESVGGQMGMTWAILLSMQGAALAWIQTRIPRFGMLASQGAHEENDRLFRRLTYVSFAVVAIGGAIFCAAVWLLNSLEPRGAESSLGLASSLLALAQKVAGRLLPPTTTAVFTLGIVLMHLPICQMTYIRAHKREPFLWLTAASNLAIGGLAWLFGREHGPIGAATAYVAVVALFTLPGTAAISQRTRRAILKCRAN